MKERFLDVIKWGLIILIAGAVLYWLGYLDFAGKTKKQTPSTLKQPLSISSRYSLQGAGQGVAYKFDKETGEVWLVSSDSVTLLKEKERKEINDKRQKEKKIDERLSKAEKFLAGWERGTSERLKGSKIIDDLGIFQTYNNLAEIEKAYREGLNRKEKERMREKQRGQMRLQILEMMERVDAEFKARKKGE